MFDAAFAAGLACIGLLVCVWYIRFSTGCRGQALPDGAVVVITGCSAGIGAELARRYASSGCNLHLCARRQPELDKVAKECRLLGAASVSTSAVDVSNKGQCDKFIDEVKDAHGQLDVLICNAGQGQSFFLDSDGECDEQAYRRFMDVNFYGCVWCTTRAMPLLEKSKGRIVVVSSLGGLVPFPRQTLYNASKFALTGFFDTLRIELLARRSPVSITLVCPSFVTTEMTTQAALGRDGQPLGAAKLKNMGGSSMMSLSACVDCILPAVAQRQRTSIIPGKLRPVTWIYYLCPSLLDYSFASMFCAGGSRRPAAAAKQK